MRLTRSLSSIALIFFLVGACRPVIPTGTPTIEPNPPLPSMTLIAGSPTAQFHAGPTSPLPSGLPRQLTPTTATTPPSTVVTPEILSPASISGIRQVGLVQYSPWDLILAVSWSPDGNRIAAAAGESIYIYTRDLKEVSRLTTGTWTNSLVFNPDGSRLVSGGRDGQIQIWDIQNERLIMSLQAHKKGVNAVAFSPDGSILASGGNDAVVRLWNPLSGKRLAQMIGGTYAVPALAFSPDGAELAIANGELIRIREVETSRFVNTLRSEGSNFSSAWSPNGKLLAAGNTTGDISFWDLRKKPPAGTFSEPIATIAGLESLVWWLDFSPDGVLLAVSDNQGTIYFLDVESKDILFSQATTPQGITSLAFSPDGRYLVSGGLDGALRLWASR